MATPIDGISPVDLNYPLNPLSLQKKQNPLATGYPQLPDSLAFSPSNADLHTDYSITKPQLSSGNWCSRLLL